MKNRRKRELAVSAIALASIGAGLFLGSKYLKNVSAGNNASLSADVAEVVPPIESSASLAVVSTEESTSSSVPTSTLTISTTSVKAVPKVKPKKITLPAAPPAAVAVSPLVTTQTVTVTQTAPALAAPIPTEPLVPLVTPPSSSVQPIPSTTISVSQTPQILPYSMGTFGNGFADGDGWSSWWGNDSQTGGVLTVEAASDSTGGGVILQGSGEWTDYTFQATVDWIKGQVFGLVVRYVDDKNYVACDFYEPMPGTVQVTIEQFVNGVQTDLATGNVANYNQAGGTGINAIFAVQGNQAICAFNGTKILTLASGNPLNSVSHGSVGFVTWDPKMNNSEIVIRNVGVTRGSYNF